MMLHLASKSPRRRELLGRLGLEFGVLDLDVPEQREPGEGPADYVRRVARAKAGAGGGGWGGRGRVWTCPAGYLALVLHRAPKSPRRRELLGRLGLEFGVLDRDVPGQREPGEGPADYVRRVAREKAGAGLLRVVDVPGAAVLGADTEVILGDEVFGKPRDAEDAAGMLRRLSGRTHEVVSAVSVVSAGREAQAVSVSQVTFGELSEAQKIGRAHV